MPLPVYPVPAALFIRVYHRQHDHKRCHRCRAAVAFHYYHSLLALCVGERCRYSTCGVPVSGDATGHCCRYCCPHNYTEPYYFQHPDQCVHLPTLLPDNIAGRSRFARLTCNWNSNKCEFNGAR